MNRISDTSIKTKHEQGQVNNANSAFILIINLFIIQGCQSGSVGRGGQVGDGLVV